MGLIEKLTGKLKGPVFLKDNSEAEQQLKTLEELRKTATGKTAELIEQDIWMVQAGILGEKQIRFELENSHIPMYVLHDLYLEYDGLSAQIDYFIITRMHQFVIECKNLYGDIEINGNGDFTRTVSYGRHRKKEGMYSPITQNRRHMELIKQMRVAEKHILVRSTYEKNFFSNYRSVVVLANPKTVLNARHAKKEVRDQVIRADQLAEYIRKVDAERGSISSSEKEMEKLAQYFLSAHKPHAMDYTEKYRAMIEADAGKQPEVAESPAAPVPQPEVAESPVAPVPQPEMAEQQDAESLVCPRCGAPMVKRKAKKGANAGKEFYGCSNYPKCRCIINIQ